MRILLDECVDERLRHLLIGHDCQTANFAKLAGLKNGRLLEAAEALQFDVLLTVDQNIPDQQNLSNRRIAIVILCAATNRLQHLSALIPQVLERLQAIEPGSVARIQVKRAGSSKSRNTQ